MVNAIIQRVYNYLLVNRARKYIDPFYHSTGNEIGFVLIGNVISVSGHAKVDGLSNLEISGKMRVDERRIRKPRYILVTNEDDWVRIRVIWLLIEKFHSRGLQGKAIHTAQIFSNKNVKDRSFF